MLVHPAVAAQILSPARINQTTASAQQLVCVQNGWRARRIVLAHRVSATGGHAGKAIWPQHGFTVYTIIVWCTVGCGGSAQTFITRKCRADSERSAMSFQKWKSFSTGEQCTHARLYRQRHPHPRSSQTAAAPKQLFRFVRCLGRARFDLVRDLCECSNMYRRKSIANAQIRVPHASKYTLLHGTEHSFIRFRTIVPPILAQRTGKMLVPARVFVLHLIILHLCAHYRVLAPATVSSSVLFGGVANNRSGDNHQLNRTVRVFKWTPVAKIYPLCAHNARCTRAPYVIGAAEQIHIHITFGNMFFRATAA